MLQQTARNIQILRNYVQIFMITSSLEVNLNKSTLNQVISNNVSFYEMFIIGINFIYKKFLPNLLERAASAENS